MSVWLFAVQSITLLDRSKMAAKQIVLVPRAPVDSVVHDVDESQHCELGPKHCCHCKVQQLGPSWWPRIQAMHSPPTIFFSGFSARLGMRYLRREQDKLNLCHLLSEFDAVFTNKSLEEACGR